MKRGGERRLNWGGTQFAGLLVDWSFRADASFAAVFLGNNILT